MSKEARWGLIIGAGMLLLTALAVVHQYGAHVLDQRREAAARKPSLVPVSPIDTRDGGPDPEPLNIPFDVGQPTDVSFRNESGGEALIWQVIFHNLTMKRTPSHRYTVARAAPTISVTFTPRDYRRRQEDYRIQLRNRVPVAGGETVTIRVEVVDPEKAGNTYVGTLTAYFDGGRHQSEEKVEVDIVAKSFEDSDPDIAP